MTERKVFTLCVRTWRDKTHGNTYYSMRVVPPTTYRSPLTNEERESFTFSREYGHGWATYVDRATKWAEAYGLDTTGARFIVDEVEVTRKKDLHTRHIR